MRAACQNGRPLAGDSARPPQPSAYWSVSVTPPATITAGGHYDCNEEIKRGLVIVVQNEDGTNEVLEPAEFERNYGWKNKPDTVHLLEPLAP